MYLKETTFAVIDVETTGLFPMAGDRICEIGVLKVSPDGRRQVYESLIDPGRALSPGAFMVNRITREMLEGKPCIKEVMPAVLDLIRGAVVVGYNIAFDMGFIRASTPAARNEADTYTVIDALRLARRLFPGLRRYGLTHVASSLGIDAGKSHRAMADVELTWQVFREELERLEEAGISRVDQIQAFLGAKPAISKKPFAGEDIYDTLRQALREGATVEITYRSQWSGDVTVRRVRPVGVDERYLKAFCELRKGRRNFRIDSIVKVEAGR